MTTNSNIQDFIQDKLKELLSSINEGFNDNELAYLSVQTKNELQIRDKIAWRLHNELIREYGQDTNYVVRREWGFNYGQTDSKLSFHSKVDLAILELTDDKKDIKQVLALIEFKAQSIVRDEKWYIDEFVHDMEKMKAFTSVIDKRNNNKLCEHADLYFVFLETGQSELPDKYKPILGFAKYVSGTIFRKKNEKDFKDEIEKHFNKFKSGVKGRYYKKDHQLELKNEKKLQISDSKAIGNTYGYKVYIASLLIGPYKGSDITVK